MKLAAVARACTLPLENRVMHTSALITAMTLTSIGRTCLVNEGAERQAESEALKTDVMLA